MHTKMMKKKRMFAWNLTAKTIMHVDEWKFFLKKWLFRRLFLVYPMKLTNKELIKYYYVT